MRDGWAILAAAAIGLASCAPRVVDSGAEGVGFSSYSTSELRAAQANAAREARLEGLEPRISEEQIASAPPVSVAPLPAAGAPLPTTAAAVLPPATLPPAQAAVPQAGDIAAATSPETMSDENDFAAVASRETIESDKARIEQNRAAYQQVQPTANPERTGASDTMVIDFALTTSNSIGQKMYDRGSRVSQDRFYRACARYGSQDAAQEDFLKNGGPQRDGKYLDPDGDGFACFWDPTPFRQARLGAVAPPVAREVLPGQDSANGG